MFSRDRLQDVAIRGLNNRVEFFASLLICVALIAVLAVFSSRMERRQIQRKKEENEASRKDTYERHQNISKIVPRGVV